MQLSYSQPTSGHSNTLIHSSLPSLWPMDRVQKAIDGQSCNALLLKVNQIGSVTEAIEVSPTAASCSSHATTTDFTMLMQRAIPLPTDGMRLHSGGNTKALFGFHCCYLQAVAMAQGAGWGVMTSHRSGETEDTFIADLAVGLCTGQIKVGSALAFPSVVCARNSVLTPVCILVGPLAAYVCPYQLFVDIAWVLAGVVPIHIQSWVVGRAVVPRLVHPAGPSGWQSTTSCCVSRRSLATRLCLQAPASGSPRRRSSQIRQRVFRLPVRIFAISSTHCQLQGGGTRDTWRCEGTIRSA